MTASLFTDLGRAVDPDGATLSGAKWYFYLTGTTTPATVYTSSTLGTPLANPVVADSGGLFANIYFDPTILYRAILKNSAGTTLQDIDPVNDDAAYAFATLSNVPRNFNISGAFSLASLGTPASGSYFGAGGNALSFNTLVSNPSGGADTDNQRATALFKSATLDDGNSEEQTVCILTSIATGYRTLYANSTAYALNANFVANGNVYRVTTAGTSAAAGSGPSTKGTGITDGTLVCKWINDSSIDSKVGLYIETSVTTGAGSSWGCAENLQIGAGVLADFIVGRESDLTNNSGTDSTIGGKNRYNLYVQNNGTSVSTSAIDVGSSNSANFAGIWGLHLTGAKLASNAVIGIDASGAVYGIGFGSAGGGVGTPTYTTAVIKDGSTAPRGIVLSGTYAKTPVSSALLPNYANDAAASAGGLSVGDWYRNGSIVMQRVA